MNASPRPWRSLVWGGAAALAAALLLGVAVASRQLAAPVPASPPQRPRHLPPRHPRSAPVPLGGVLVAPPALEPAPHEELVVTQRDRRGRDLRDALLVAGLRLEQLSRDGAASSAEAAALARRMDRAREALAALEQAGPSAWTQLRALAGFAALDLLEEDLLADE